jgi:hypothetical protein
MRFIRTLAVLAMLGTALDSSPPVLAQDSASQVGDVFAQLTQLQDANLGIARQMAETEQRAASELRAAIEDGTISNPAYQAVARSFVANALTLASVILSPIQTRQAAAGNTMMLLIQRNIALLQSTAPYARKNRSFSNAIARYTVLQMQTQDLGSALQNGWNRYAGILANAQSSGLLADNAFDAGSQSWNLEIPVLGNPDVAAVVPPAVTTTTAVATTTTTATTTTAFAEAEPPVPATPPPGLTAQPEAAARTTTTTTTTAAAPVPVPALTGTPRGPAETVATTIAEAAAEPPPAGQPEDTAERLPAGGPLDIVRPAAATGPVGDWMLTADGPRTFATTPNLNTETLPVIQGLTVRCAPDGGVQYVIAAKDSFGAFRVYSDRSQYRTVRADDNVIAADNTVAIADTLRLAYAWSQQVPDSGRQLTIRADTLTGTLGLFSPKGYPEARDKVAIACANPAAPAVLPMDVPVAETRPAVTAPPETAADAAAAPTQPTEAATPAAEPAPETPAPEAVATTTAAAPTPPPRDTRPPIPAPRINRQNLPLDIMNGG